MDTDKMRILKNNIRTSLIWSICGSWRNSNNMVCQTWILLWSSH